jgi:hypothetical protein
MMTDATKRIADLGVSAIARHLSAMGVFRPIDVGDTLRE